MTQIQRKEGEFYRELGFKYDGAGRRVEKLFVDYKNASESYVKRYVYDGQNQMKAVFVNGEGIDDPRMMIRDEDGNTYFEQDEAYAYTKDHLGSIREIVDHKGEVRQRYSYSSYGETKIAKIGNSEKLIDSPYGFTGRELDLESGDYYYRARYYDPQTGRFLSQDPIGFRGGDTNLYRYVGNNPTGRNDPFGLAWWDEIKEVYDRVKDTEDIIDAIKQVVYCKINPKNCDKDPDDAPDIPNHEDLENDEPKIYWPRGC